MRFDIRAALGWIVICVLTWRQTTSALSTNSRYYHHDLSSSNLQRILQDGGESPPDGTRITANATYTYFIYTNAPSSVQVLDEVRTFVQTKLETSFEDLVEDVQLTVMQDEVLPEGCPVNAPASVPPGYTATCTKYSTYIEASMERQWEEEIFSRTVVQTIKKHMDAYNVQATKSAFVVYNSPIEVRTDVTLLLVGARQLMTIYEYSFMADIMQYFVLDPERGSRALENDPPLNISNVEYLWQRVVERGAPSPPSQQQQEGGGGGGRIRRRNQATNLPPLSIQVEMLVVATCAGVEECTHEALSQYVIKTFPQMNGVFLEKLKEWSQTNYFRDGGITAVVLDTEDPNPTFINTPELPPDSNYRTPGVQEEDKPLWIWFALLIALGALFMACVYVTFCITARDFQAARKMRRERRQSQIEEKEGRQRLQTEDNDQRDALPPSPTRQSGYFASAPAPPPEQPEEVEFDVTESNRVEDANIAEVRRSPGKKKKSKKEKKKSSAEGDAASPDKAASSPRSKSPSKSRSDSPKKSRSKSPNKKKKSNEGDPE